MPVNTTVERIIYEGVDRITAVSKQSADGVKALRQGLDSVKNALAAVGVTVGAGALVSLYMDTLKAVGALDDMAESTGASVEGLSAIQRVAKIGGHDFEGLTGQIGRMVKGLREGSEEGGRAAQAFAFLNIKARESDGRFRDTGEILVELAKKLETVTSRADRVLLVQDALGRRAERYLPLLKEMAEGTDLHATVTAKQAQEAEEAEKNIRRLTAAFEDSRRELVNEYTPAIGKFLERLLEARRATGNIVAGGLMALFSGDDLRAELKEVEAELAEVQRNSRAAQIASVFTFGVSGAITGMQESRLLQRQEFLQRLLARQEAAAARAGRADPSSPLFEFGGQGVAYEPRDEDRKGAEFVARQLEEGAEEERRIQAEAAALTAAFREREREQMRKFRALDLQETDDYYQSGGAMLIASNEERNRVLMENADREEELEIQRGEVILEADGMAHSFKLDLLRRSLMTGEELENEAFRLRLEALREFSDEELEILGGIQAVKEKMEAEHQERVNALSNRGNRNVFQFIDAARKGDLQSATGHFASLTAGFAQHSRKMFELNKIAARADATVSMAAGISKSLSAYPMPWAAIAAAAHAALFVVQLQAISSAQFGGGAPAPSVVGGGTPATPVTPVGGAQAPGMTTIINLPSGRKLFTLDEMQDLFELMNEEGRRGGRLDRVLIRQS